MPQKPTILARPLRRQPADRHHAIVQALVARIKAGVWTPGQRLPRWRDLAQEFDTSLPTISKAMARLAECGFIQNGGWHGARVAERLPHLSRYGLVFYKPLLARNGESTSRYWDALIRASQAVRADASLSFNVYEDVYGKPTQPDSVRLEADLETGCLAGLIFSDVYPLAESPLARLVEHPVVPLACLGNTGEVPVPSVVPDWHSVIQRGVAHLAERGCRRLAVLVLQSVGQEHLDCLRAEQARLGLPVDDALVMGLASGSSGWTEHWVKLLLALPKARRPEAFLVTDDHLTPGLVQALHRQGLQPGPALPVVSHGNFPGRECETITGVSWLGFDLPELLRRAVAVARLPKPQGRVATVNLSAVFENERHP